MSNTAYRTFFASTLSRIWNFKITISEIIEDVQNNKVVVFASSTVDSKAGVGSYGQEYVLLFEFEESREKIRRMVEWVDSVRAKEQVALLFG
jgi:ketosteroid isomerase-like protein